MLIIREFTFYNRMFVNIRSTDHLYKLDYQTLTTLALYIFC